MTTTRFQRTISAVCCGALAAAAVSLPPVTVAQNCGSGFERNPYNSQCLAPVITPVINGVPCVPSNLGLCRSFTQNQQPRRVPRTSIG